MGMRTWAILPLLVAACGSPLNAPLPSSPEPKDDESAPCYWERQRVQDAKDDLEACQDLEYQ